MHDDNIYDNIVTWLGDWAKPVLFSSKRLNVSRDTTLEGDLGISGDDAELVMASFFEVFDVDPGGFFIGYYFESEGLSIPWITDVVRRLFRLQPFYRGPTYDLRIGDLEQIVILGRWEDPSNLNEERKRL